MTFDPTSVEVTGVTLPKDHCVQVPWEYINVCGYSDEFCKLPHTYIHILRTYYVHTTYYILHTTYRISDHIVSLRRDKNMEFWVKAQNFSKWKTLYRPFIQCHFIGGHEGLDFWLGLSVHADQFFFHFWIKSVNFHLPKYMFLQISQRDGTISCSISCFLPKSWVAIATSIW